MSWVLGDPKFTAYLDGEPLEGGILYFYLPGTTTAKQAFPTIADAVAGTNGFTSKVLDAQGQPLTTDMIVMNGSYKLKLTDSVGTVIWTVDNVNGQHNIYDVNGLPIVKFNATASAVNWVEITNKATGVAPVISSEGENNIGLDLADSNQNEMLRLRTVASAVNEVTITAAATANSPTVEVTGGDTNIDMAFQTKGTGTYQFKGTSTAPAGVRLYEDTDNGTNYMAFAAPSSVTANTTLTLPNGDGAANTALITNGSGTLSWSTLTAVAATQSNQETATSTTTVVTPAVQQYHPSAAKFWCNANGTGTIAADQSYNLTALIDTAVGRMGFTIATDFSTDTYAIAAMTGDDDTTAGAFVCYLDGVKQVGRVDIGTCGMDGTLFDCDDVSIIAFGDQ